MSNFEPLVFYSIKISDKSAFIIAFDREAYWSENRFMDLAREKHVLSNIRSYPGSSYATYFEHCFDGGPDQGSSRR